MASVGSRIRELRKSIGMSQVDFADKIGVSKQTLYKYENDLITNIPSDKIEAAAIICGVSPAALMGWLDDPEPADPEPIVLTLEEQTLLRNYKQLNRDGQLHLLEYADNMTHMLKYSKETSLTEENIG